MNKYGRGDDTYRALGEMDGIRALVDAFYNTMESDATYQVIWTWHTEDRKTMRDKLALFLCMWSGGPRDYVEKYGQISIPAAHKHLNVTEVERDLWINCMSSALQEQRYPNDLIDYMKSQLARPAEAIRRQCAHAQ